MTVKADQSLDLLIQTIISNAIFKYLLPANEIAVKLTKVIKTKAKQSRHIESHLEHNYSKIIFAIIIIINLDVTIKRYHA